LTIVEPVESDAYLAFLNDFSAVMEEIRDADEGANIDYDGLDALVGNFLVAEKSDFLKVLAVMGAAIENLSGGEWDADRAGRVQEIFKTREAEALNQFAARIESEFEINNEDEDGKIGFNADLRKTYLSALFRFVVHGPKFQVQGERSIVNLFNGIHDDNAESREKVKLGDLLDSELLYSFSSLVEMPNQKERMSFYIQHWADNRAKIGWARE